MVFYVLQYILFQYILLRKVQWNRTLNNKQNKQTSLLLTITGHYFQDRYADAKRLPPKDKEQNYVLTSSEESDKKTVLRFTRKFETCDPKDRKIEVNWNSNNRELYFIIVLNYCLLYSYRFN